MTQLDIPFELERARKRYALLSEQSKRTLSNAYLAGDKALIAKTKAKLQYAAHAVDYWRRRGIPMSERLATHEGIDLLLKDIQLELDLQPAYPIESAPGLALTTPSPKRK